MDTAEMPPIWKTMKHNSDLTAERLRQLLSYDEATGVFTWNVARNRVPAGAVAGNLRYGYIRIRVDKTHYQAHRLAWLYVHGEWPEAQVDHVNRVKTDNRIANLREATSSQNGQNKGLLRSNTSGVTGVCWRGHRNKWCAFIVKDGRHINLGLYADKADAVLARAKAAAVLHTHAPQF